jgi:hypothetical protein
MIPAQGAISRLRRDLTVSSLLKGIMLAAAVACLLLEATPLPRTGIGASVILVLIGGLWMLLSAYSFKGSRLAAASPSLIASGDFEQAEHQIDEALRSFSLFRAVKLRSFHHLALLRHAQKRWGEAAILAQALLTQRLGALAGLSRSARLILAESLLEVGDVHGAYHALRDLSSEHLALGESLALSLVQLDYCAKIGAWSEMLQQIEQRIPLIDLMAAGASAKSQALLALAARKLGKTQWEVWLRRRAEMLSDVNQLVAHRPILAELWPQQADTR